MKSLVEQVVEHNNGSGLFENIEYSKAITKLARGIAGSIVHGNSSSFDDMKEAAQELHKMDRVDPKRERKFMEAIRDVLLKFA